MATADKKKKRKKKKPPRPEGKPERLTAFEKPGPPDPRDPEGRALPSLLQAVEELLPWEYRSTIVNRLCPLYGVSARTVDRAIQHAKDEFRRREQRTRDEKISDGLKQLDNIARAAARAGKYQAARSAIVDRHKLAGNFVEKIDLGGSLGSVEEGLALAKELEAAAIEAQARAKAQK